MNLPPSPLETYGPSLHVFWLTIAATAALSLIVLVVSHAQ